MTGLLDVAPDKPTTVRAVTRAVVTWPHVALAGLILVFIMFCLWLTATKFDSSEIKAGLPIALAWMATHVIPLIRNALKSVGDGIAAGNE